MVHCFCQKFVWNPYLGTRHFTSQCTGIFHFNYFYLLQWTFCACWWYQPFSFSSFLLFCCIFASSLQKKRKAWCAPACLNCSLYSSKRIGHFTDGNEFDLALQFLFVLVLVEITTPDTTTRHSNKLSFLAKRSWQDFWYLKILVFVCSGLYGCGWSRWSFPSNFRLFISDFWFFYLRGKPREDCIQWLHSSKANQNQN